MPLDAVCIHALVEELRERILGGRIDKVQQPERDMLLLSLRSEGANRRLLIAVEQEETDPDVRIILPSEASSSDYIFFTD